MFYEYIYIDKDQDRSDATLSMFVFRDQNIDVSEFIRTWDLGNELFELRM